ncbi:hypothetical protein cyc_03727 [Cyclospora cayetanensis]|uniref:Uncharacterized protein n=1 Tax=Cyclospora cayetanensis TaxID=88456 RepID=A0A1D3D9S7_9EIME|nr:hypothetical protein cyc_03727 [Cyclospora cayetanensis]
MLKREAGESGGGAAESPLQDLYKMGAELQQQHEVLVQQLGKIGQSIHRNAVAAKSAEAAVAYINEARSDAKVYRQIARLSKKRWKAAHGREFPRRVCNVRKGAGGMGAEGCSTAVRTPQRLEDKYCILRLSGIPPVVCVCCVPLDCLVASSGGGASPEGVASRAALLLP